MAATALQTIITGGAHSSESGGKNGTAGDQKQEGVPDYSGEVSMREKTEAQFKASYSGYTLYRFTNPGQASDAADYMIRACNNPNIGYSQATRQGIFNYGCDSTTPINCDCSSLVSYCVTMAGGKTVNTTTSGLPDALMSTGLFMDPMPVASISFMSNPPYNGDVLVKAGTHTEMVVSGNPRSGSDNEITAGTYEGDGGSIDRYSNNYGGTYPFSARTKSPPVIKERESSAGKDKKDKSKDKSITVSSEDIYYDHEYGVTYNGIYAWGRFSEILHAFSNLCRGIPRKWYSYGEDNYARGSQILLGSVMCYTHATDLNDPGVVCIVEKIESTKIYASWVHPTTGRFGYFDMIKDDGKWDLDVNKDGTKEYIFQGCIYNPAVDNSDLIKSSVDSFVRIAKEEVGDQGNFTANLTGIVPKRDAWSAAFIVAVAKKTGGILDRIIPETFACSSIGRIGVDRDMGTWFDGPAHGGDPNPNLGDIILFRTTALKRKDTNKYAADKAGIVVNIGNSNGYKSGKNETPYKEIDIVMGDVDDKVANITFKTTSNQISGYFRPYWKKIGGYTYQVHQIIDDGGLYTEGTSLEDAALRDIRYITIEKNGLKPSIKSSGITLSAINYTGMIANFYTAFSESGTSPGYEVDMMMDNWNASNGNGGSYGGSASQSDYGIYVGAPPEGQANSKVVQWTDQKGNQRSETITITSDVMTMYNSLSKFLNNSSGAIGFLGNIFQESRFNPAAGKGRTSGPIGLCQWLIGGRGDAMVSFCGKGWANNLSAQLKFIMSELDSSYIGVKNTCSRVTLSMTGAFDACDCVLRKYEVPGNYGYEGPLRQAFTQAIYELIIGF